MRPVNQCREVQSWSRERLAARGQQLTPLLGADTMTTCLSVFPSQYSMVPLLSQLQEGKYIWLILPPLMGQG